MQAFAIFKEMSEKIKLHLMITQSALLTSLLSIKGLPHETVAKLIAECFAKRDRNTLTMVVMDQKLTPAEMRRSFMQPQC